MLNYNEVRPGKIIIMDGEPYLCIDNGVMQKQMRRPVNQTKLKHLVKGTTVEKAFQQSDKVEEADIGKKELKYLYTNRGESWFCDANNPADRVTLSQEILGDMTSYIKPNEMVEGVVFDEKVISIKLPIKVELKVVEAPPNVRGDTAQGGSKQVKTETGLMVSTPLFIEMGDIIVVNTDTGDYVERAKKA